MRPRELSGGGWGADAAMRPRAAGPHSIPSRPRTCAASISASSCATTRSITPPLSPLPPRAGASESSSSKNMTHGRARRARANASRTCREGESGREGVRAGRRAARGSRSGANGRRCKPATTPLLLCHVHSLAPPQIDQIAPPRSHEPDLAPAHLPLALSHVHVDELRPLDRQKICTALRGHRLGQQRLAAARRAVQQHARPPPQAAGEELSARVCVSVFFMCLCLRVCVCVCLHI